MFLLNEKPLALDVPFTTADGTQYPANWLRLASAEEKAAIGITEVADPAPYDDRFYWGVNNPKQLEDETVTPEGGEPYTQKGLKSQMIAQVKATAGSLLAATDWKIVRASEGIKPVDADTLAARSAIRAASDANEAAITACTSVDALAALQMVWPSDKNV